MATLTFPHNWSAGDTVSATELMAQFNSIKTFLETTKLDPANLTKPNGLFAISAQHLDTLSGGTSNEVILRWDPPVGIGIVPVMCSLAFEEKAAGNPTVSLMVSNTLPILSGPLTTSTVGNAVNTTSFTGGSFMGTEFVFELSETAGVGNDAKGISVVWWMKAQHRGA